MLNRLVLPVRRRIAAKLTLTLVGFAALSSLAAGLYVDRALDGFAEEAVEARLQTVARLVQEDARALLGNEAAAEVPGLLARVSRSTGARMTLIDRGGRVVADSEHRPEDVPRLENLAGRPEVAAALGGIAGRDVRAGGGPGPARLVYTAVPVLDDGRVIGALRLALPRADATAAEASLRGVMRAGGLVVLAVAFGIGIFVARRVTRPVLEMQSIARQMSEGQFAVRAPVRSPDEIGVLGRSLNVMAGRLRDQIQDLAQEQAKATAILDAMVEGVIAVDGHDHVLVTNERARAMFGLGAARGDRRPFLEVIRNADLHELLREGRAAEVGAVVRRELSLTTPASLVVQAHAAPVRLDEGTWVVMVLHDITTLRHLEQVRTEFVANVSHELRTPLTAIQGYLETLLSGALEEPEHGRRFLEIVFRHTERLGRLLNDLTDLSNIELGRVSLRLEPTPLEDVVESALAIIRVKAEAGGVAVRAAMPAGLPAVRADRDRLAQILINLVDNAVKYTAAGGRVTVSALAPGPGVVEVSVADTGVGIPPSDLPRISERFYRVDKARSRELGGTGLGLAIVKHLVHAHGGELGIESEVDRGTRVRFTLPADRPPGAVPPEPGQPATSGPPG